MKATGMVRPVDKMGRVVIPKEIRQQLGVQNEVDSFEIYTENNYVILKKYQPSCVFCERLGSSVEFNGHTVCYECIEKLNLKKQKEQNI